MTDRDYLQGWLLAATRTPLTAAASYPYRAGFRAGMAARRLAEAAAHVPRQWPQAVEAKICSECGTGIRATATSGCCRVCYWRKFKQRQRRVGAV